ncbi:MAG: hypothetical protein AAF236_02455, partial [Verrucomicrobiota bacterium]
PLIFRMLWRRARHATRPESRELLESRGFTEPGAKRASRIYRENAKLAALDGLEIEPELPERGRPAAKNAANKVAAEKPELKERLKQRARRLNARRRAENSLTLPFGAGTAVIPKGLSEGEYGQLMQTLRACRELLVTQA